MGINPNAKPGEPATVWFVGLLVAALALAGICWAVWRSKHESAEMNEIVGGLDDI
jgi:hypothetical protein